MKIHITRSKKNLGLVLPDQLIVGKKLGQLLTTEDLGNSVEAIRNEWPELKEDFKLKIRGGSGFDGCPMKNFINTPHPVYARYGNLRAKKRFRPNRVSAGIVVIDCVIEND